MSFEIELQQLLEKHHAKLGSPVFNLAIPHEEVANYATECIRAYIFKRVDEIIKDRLKKNEISIKDVLDYIYDLVDDDFISSLKQNNNLFKNKFDFYMNKYDFSYKPKSSFRPPFSGLKHKHIDPDSVAIRSNN